MRWTNRENLARGLATAAVVVLGAATAACSDDDGGGGGTLSREALAGAGTCPVDLPAAVEEAGFEADGDPTVEVTEGSGGAGQDAAAIDQVGGVFVECRQEVSDGEVTSVLFASDQPAAISMLLPLIQSDLGISVDEIENVLTRTEDTDVGELVDLDVVGPGAVARLDIDGAESGVLYVSSTVASPDDVRTVAENLLAGL